MLSSRQRASLYGVAQGSGAILQFGILGLLARQLTESDLGLYLLIWATAQVLETMSDLGGRYSVLRAMSLAPGVNVPRSDYIAGWSIRLVGLLVVLSIAIALLLASVLPAIQAHYWLWVLAIVWFLPSSSPATWALRASGLQSVEGFLLVLQKLILLGLILAAGTQLNLAGAVFSTFISLAVTALLSWWMCRRLTDSSGFTRAAALGESARRLLVAGYPFSISQAGSLLAPRIYLFVLAGLVSAAELAAVGIAQSVVLSTLMVPVIVQAVFLPHFARSFSADPRRTVRDVGMLASVLFGGGWFMAMALVVLSPMILRLLTGQTDPLYVDLLRAFSGAVPFICASFYLRTVLAATGRAGAEPVVTWLEVLAGVVASIFMFQSTGLVSVFYVMVAILAAGSLVRFRLASTELTGLNRLVRPLLLIASIGTGGLVLMGVDQLAAPVATHAGTLAVWIGCGAAIAAVVLNTCRDFSPDSMGAVR